MIRNWKKSSSKGFTLIEALLALCICSICTLLLSYIASSLRLLSQDFRHNDDNVAIHQLRLLLVSSYDIKIENTTLLYEYKGNQEMLYYHNHRLVRKGGYEVFLQNIDEIDFIYREQCIHMYWTRKEMKKHATLVCE